ncbi:MAG: 50S ribosomal protein L11 methyltransferase [Gammaproteobacteria bacterium]|nr:50S ribosomal protein L11 methyltransferase [Gammaproteobacteria bacterium]
MPWLQLHLTIDKEQAPLVELLFDNLGTLSITLGDALDEPLLEPAPGETPLWQQTRVTGLFSGDRDADELRSTINQALNNDVSRNLELEILEDQVWERTWMEDFHPMQFGRRLWICPNGLQPEAKDPITIDLDPGLAFGTGTHPTTALCLEWLDSADLTGKIVLDFGCGSGILAVAALKLGASLTLAIDHDTQALEATQENARKNGVADNLQIIGSKQLNSYQVDITLANILAGTLIELEPLFAEHTRSGGEIILSGILTDQASQVSNRFASDFNMASPKQRGDWVLLHGVRR